MTGFTFSSSSLQVHPHEIKHVLTRRLGSNTSTYSVLTVDVSVSVTVMIEWFKLVLYRKRLCFLLPWRDNTAICIYRSVAVTVRCCQFAVQVVARSVETSLLLHCLRFSYLPQTKWQHDRAEWEGRKKCTCFVVETSVNYCTTLHISINKFPFGLSHKSVFLNRWAAAQYRALVL
jgi:hypothetical protein